LVIIAGHAFFERNSEAFAKCIEILGFRKYAGEILGAEVMGRPIACSTHA